MPSKLLEGLKQQALDCLWKDSQISLLSPNRGADSGWIWGWWIKKTIWESLPGQSLQLALWTQQSWNNKKCQHSRLSSLSLYWAPGVTGARRDCPPQMGFRAIREEPAAAPGTSLVLYSLALRLFSDHKDFSVLACLCPGFPQSGSLYDLWKEHSLICLCLQSLISKVEGIKLFTFKGLLTG